MALTATLSRRPTLSLIRSCTASTLSRTPLPLARHLTSRTPPQSPSLNSQSSASPPPSRPSPFASSPSPPRLDAREQALYESLQSSSRGAFSTPRVNQSPSPTSSPPIKEPTAHVDASVQASGKGEELHPDVRRGAKPEFEGDRNPKTGEVGGPKNEPLRWGDGGDWSYNGRVTDF